MASLACRSIDYCSPLELIRIMYIVCSMLYAMHGQDKHSDLRQTIPDAVPMNGEREKKRFHLMICKAINGLPRNCVPIIYVYFTQKKTYFSKESSRKTS